MQVYIALLRGINVGGHKKIRMAALREALTKNGFEQVQTYIQSGNIIFQAKETDTLELAASIHKIIENSFGFLVPVLVVLVEDIRMILEKNPFGANPEENQLFFTLLKQSPDLERVSEFKKLTFENERFHIVERCVYLSFKGGYHNAKLSNNFIENKLKVEATSRNLRTMEKLLEMAKG